MERCTPNGKVLPEDNLNLRYFRSAHPNERRMYKAMALTGNFTSGAIKEILSQMVWGFNPGKAIIFVPESAVNFEVLTSEDLMELRSYTKHDRLCELDIKAMDIKSAQAAVIVERFR